MDIPETRYATTEEGISIAYQTVGDGPVDLVLDTAIFGNVEIMWELAPLADLFGRLSSFSRLILHDCRGTGISGGYSVPNLETRARDLLTVLDTCRSTRTALFGALTGGAALAMFAATYPDRVSSFVWFNALARTSRSPEYPWGDTPEEQRQTIEGVREFIGKPEAIRDWLEENGPGLVGDERLIGQIARLDRHFIAPSTAVDWVRTWFETDVTHVLGVISCPTLLIDHEASPTGAAESRFVQALIADAELVLIPGDPGQMVFSDRGFITDTVREFLGVERKPIVADTVLASVLFTDIVGSTEKQASLGDRAWNELVGRHHAIVRDALERWRGVENDTAGDGFFATFDGPARAVRCALDVIDRVRDLGIEIRAGVHTGECEVIDGKHAGLAVTIGSRVASIAGSSEVLVSRTVKDLTAGSGFTFEDVGDHELKGVPHRWHLYRVVG
ncbi:MAG: adenylate/guanylate cyclase domain-containing protein [Actinomycetota bacterium]